MQRTEQSIAPQSGHLAPAPDCQHESRTNFELADLASAYGPRLPAAVSYLHEARPLPADWMQRIGHPF